MELRKATRKKAKIRLGLSAVSGGGKTYSALLIAFGMTGDWSKIAVIDTENNSADLYSHLGDYNVISLTSPFSPERYIEAINTIVKAGMEVGIIDSITHEWEAEGGVLQLADKIGGGFQGAWKELTPRHERFKQAIINAPIHLITTVRRKQDYDIVKDDKTGKTKPVKVGLKEVTREGWEYELTANLELDQNHNATSSKDRTGLFADKPSFVPSVETGKMIADWCETGLDVKAVVAERIKQLENCDTTSELKDFCEPLEEYVKSDVLFRAASAARNKELKAIEAKATEA